MRKSLVNLMSLTSQMTTNPQRTNQTPRLSPASITTAPAVGMATGALICTSASTRWRENVAMGPTASWTTLCPGGHPPVPATGLRNNQRLRSMVRYLFIYLSPSCSQPPSGVFLDLTFDSVCLFSVCHVVSSVRFYSVKSNMLFWLFLPTIPWSVEDNSWFSRRNSLVAAADLEVQAGRFIWMAEMLLSSWKKWDQ